MVAYAEAPEVKSDAAQIAQVNAVEEVDVGCPLKRAVIAFLGVSAIVASLGLWVFHSAGGDPLMLIIKAVMSATMLVGGMMMIQSLNNRPEPEVHIDPLNNQLRIVQVDCSGKPHLIARHDIDELSDITFRDNLLTARDAAGVQLFALQVQDKKAAEDIRESLQMVQ